MKGLLQTLKDNNALMFAVITGCLKIAKESIFTGTNNFISDTISDSRLNEYFEFVQEEVDQILTDVDIAERRDTIKAWYDGYHFGNFDVYCPWDVMNYLFDLQRNTMAKPKSYWKNTSDNAIIRSFFETTVSKWFQDTAREWNRKALFEAVWSGDCEVLTWEMNQLLRKTISYHDYKEDFYHAFLAGIFAGAGYTVKSNKEHGEGRSDVIVYDNVHARVAVFEAKYTKTLEHLEMECDKALRQMEQKSYAKDFTDDYDEIFCYGISFFEKRCMVKKCL